jgi:hypothetical protein
VKPVHGAWFDSTHVGSEPTACADEMLAAMIEVKSSASQVAVSRSKSKAWWYSSGRRYSGRRAASTHASATIIRSPSYSSSTRRQRRTIGWISSRSQ